MNAPQSRYECGALERQISELKATLAERDNQLAKAEQRNVQNALDLGKEFKLRDELFAQLLAAQTVNGKLREALEVAQLWLCNCTCVIEIEGPQPLPVIAKALALSPDPTLLDEVDDEDVKAAVALIVEAESECHAYNPSVTRISTRLHNALSRLRQSTRKTEEKV